LVPDHATLADTNQQAWTLPATGASGGWWVRVYSTSDCYFVYPAAVNDGGALPTTAYLTIPGGIPTPILVNGTTFAVAGAASQVIEVVAS
jgi:hypothetical protein